MTGFGAGPADLAALLTADIDIENVSAFKDQIIGVVEVGLLAWFFYAIGRFLRGTRGLAVFKGIFWGLVGTFFVLAMISVVFDVSFTRLEVVGMALLPIFPVVLVVLFQPEIRRGFSRLSERPLGGRSAPSQLADLSKSFERMARQRIGALVVFQRQTGFKTTQDSGVPLDAALSGAMLESIFYPKSPLHDGAVIIDGGRIVAASVMLPLTEATGLALELGTRHRAAIGVTEETDAVAVVVSEETGKMSVVHHGELFVAEDAEELANSLREHLELDRRRDGPKGFHLWRLLRHDIGQKLLMLSAACAVWFYLQQRVVGEREILLPVRVVRSVVDAEQQRRTAPAVYLVVPDGLLVDQARLRDDRELNRLRNGRVQIDLKGLREQVSNVELSAVLVVDEEMLDGQDENAVLFNLQLDDLFKAVRGEQPEFTEFDVSPDQLMVPIAREATAVFELTASSVAIQGRPRAGYTFDASTVRVAPNLVAVSGPKKRIDELRAEPSRLRLQPIDIEGRAWQVSQDVGLADELADELSLITGAGRVNVSVPIEAMPYSIELPFVRVLYVNEGALHASKRRIVSATETVDLRVTGPEPELYAQPEEWLRDRILVVFDWGRASLLQAVEKPRILTEGLSDAVKITTHDGRVPQIEYQLEPLHGLEDGDS